MTDHTTHLTEEERHDAAEGVLSSEHHARVDAHLATCEACASDVARIGAFMKRSRESAAPPAADESLNALWTPIRARIEAGKVVALDGAESVAARRPRIWLIAAGVVAAAALVTLARRAPTGDDAATRVAQVTPDSAVIRAVADSAKLYEAEAQTLLDRLEIQRATLRPETVDALERNLHTVDVAIAELKDAIARDPNNPALRQLLATSYRQKVELLKRVGNAS